MESTLIHNVNPAELTALFKDLKNELSDLKANFKPQKHDELLSYEETADALKCDRSTIHRLTKKGTLKAYGIGGRVYYKRSEIEQALTPLG